jgi:hypothetical protein
MVGQTEVLRLRDQLSPGVRSNRKERHYSALEVIIHVVVEEVLCRPRTMTVQGLGIPAGDHSATLSARIVSRVVRTFTEASVC